MPVLRAKRDKYVYVRVSRLARRLAQFPVGAGTTFAGISEKEDNFASFTQIFENFVLRISVPFDFAIRSSGIFG